MIYTLVNISLLNNNALTVNTFKDAFESRNNGEEFRSLLCSLKVVQSFSRKSNPYDNAVIESFFSCIKREKLNSHDFKFLDELELVVEQYIEFYNNFRPHNSLHNKTSNQIENEFYTNLSDKSG